MERVAQPRLDRFGPLGPFERVLEPIAALGDISPAADPREAVGDCLDIARDIVEPGHFGGEPFVRDMPALADVGVDAADHARVVHRPDLAEIGQPARRPQRACLTPLAHNNRGIFGDRLEHGEVERDRRRAQQRIAARGLEAGDQRADVGEIKLGVAPVERFERAEAMLLDRLDFLLAERRAGLAAKSQRPERPVPLVPPRAPRDLRHFGDGQPPVAASVEFLQPREGDMGDVHVEPHADRVGGDQIVDLAALEHRHLGVASRGGERAHDDRGAALEAAQHLGEAVDLLGREGDDRRARGKAGELGRAGVAQRREARARDDFGAGQQLADEGLEALRPEDQRFFASPRTQHAVGEDMATLGINAELRLVDRGKGEVALFVFLANRHALGGAQPVARLRRHDPLFPGQQRDRIGAFHRDHPVIDLAREEAQREADHARRMGAHPLDGEMGLAGVGRAKNGPDEAVAGGGHGCECGMAHAKCKRSIRGRA